MADLSDDDLLAELGVPVEPQKARTHTHREERIIAGFEDILRFRDEHGREPQHGEGRDIFERLYAVRLDRLRDLGEAHELLASIDRYELLSGGSRNGDADVQKIDDDELLSALGVEPSGDDDIRTLRHVQSAEERRAAEDIANRERCPDFQEFEPIFAQVQGELDSGARVTRPFVRDAGFLKSDIQKGQMFILGGQIVYVAEVGEALTAPNGEADARLRVIYSNGTQSNLLCRSLQRALYKDEAGRRITEPEAGPLFSIGADKSDEASGTIYVLRSKSDHPIVAQHGNLVHKIGVTNMSVEQRVAGARLQPTFLMADVEIDAEYKLFNINRMKLERIIHRVFGSAQLDLSIPDRFGTMVKPREWFLVPLTVIDEAVERIRTETITQVQYDPSSAKLVLRSELNEVERNKRN